MIKLLTFILLGLLSLNVSASPAEDQKLSSLFDDIWHQTMLSNPTYATYVGYPGQNALWPNHSVSASAENAAQRKEFLMDLRYINTERLDPDRYLEWMLVEKSLTDEVTGHAYPEQFILLHQRTGVQQDIADTLSMMPKFNLQDFTDRLARLENAESYIRSTIEVLREGLAKGITPPKITLRDVPEQIRNTIPVDIDKSPLLSSFNGFPDSIGQDEQERIKASARQIIKQQVYPAFESLLQFLEDEYIPNAKTSIALIDMPNGAEWYRHRAKSFTTSNLTPKQIHQLGLSEVKRIRQEMDKVIATSGFDGTFEEFTYFLRTDPQFYMTSADDLMVGYRDIAKRADPELAKLFGKLPRMPYGVIAIPDYAAKSQTTAYYWGG